MEQTNDNSDKKKKKLKKKVKFVKRKKTKRSKKKGKIKVKEKKEKAKKEIKTKKEEKLEEVDKEIKKTVKEKLVELKNVTVTIDNKNIIENINFYAEKGDILGLIGGSGAGKTTCLKLLTGQMIATKGVVKVLGNDLSNSKSLTRLKKKIGYVPQMGSTEDVYFQFNALRNAYFFGKMYNLDDKFIKVFSKKIYYERARKILSILGFDEALLKKPVKDLSGGEQKRVSIMVGLIHEPEILFLDEPTTGLDPSLRIEVLNFLKLLNINIGQTIVVVSHDLETATYCTKIVILREGKVIDFGNPEEMIQKISGGKKVKVECHELNNEILEKFRAIKNLDYYLKVGRRRIDLFIHGVENNLKGLIEEFNRLEIQNIIKRFSVDKVRFTDYFRIKISSDIKK
ncbi:MAG: ABC transporter ATP-binding protein [Candidatus Helarchaeota archaeon]